MPVPTPCGLVVKNGSKARFLTSGGMPGPLSSTSTTTSPSRGRRRGRRAGAAPRLDQRLLRVDDQVDQHLVQLVGVAPDRRQAGRRRRPTTVTPAVRSP